MELKFNLDTDLELENDIFVSNLMILRAKVFHKANNSDASFNHT